MDNLTTFTAAALLAFTVVTLQNFVRYARAGDWNGMLGIALAWVAGWAAVALAANTNVTDGLQLIENGPVLGKVDGGGLIMLGVAIGSSGSQFVDYLKSRDNSQSAAKPKLVVVAGEKQAA